jgi:hypothetical protein
MAKVPIVIVGTLYRPFKKNTVPVIRKRYKVAKVTGTITFHTEPIQESLKCPNLVPRCLTGLYYFGIFFFLTISGFGCWRSAPTKLNPDSDYWLHICEFFGVDKYYGYIIMHTGAICKIFTSTSSFLISIMHLFKYQ